MYTLSLYYVTIPFLFEVVSNIFIYNKLVFFAILNY